MAFHLTPAQIAVVYEALREFPPISRWALPPAEEIEFHVGVQQDAYAHYQRNGDRHSITVSMMLVTDWQLLAETVAHEMIHLHQALAGTETRAEHNREWHRLAARVCKSLGWDVRRF